MTHERWPTKTSPIVITCAKGIPEYLTEEVRSLGYAIVDEGVSHVETEGAMEDAMKLNLCLRTGQRVLFLLSAFDARGPEDLYHGVSGMRWEDLIPEEESLCVTSSVDTPSIKDSRFANVKCKDAIVDRLKKKLGRRPDSGPERDHVVVHLHWKERRCLVYLDTSGEPLSRRGYRRIPLEAPMQETLAAAVVTATGWTGTENFVNPMCGSGTLAIEAALIGLGRAPGLLRSNYGFMHLRAFDEASWKRMRKRARDGARRSIDGKIVATDIREEALEAARKNAATAGVERWVEFGRHPFAETRVPGGRGVVVLNPEYGERMGEIERLRGTYKEIGDFFKQKCQGYTGYVFTGNLDLAKFVGLRASRRWPFYSSNMPCRLLRYDLYEGSRTQKGVEGTLEA